MARGATGSPAESVAFNTGLLVGAISGAATSVVGGDEGEEAEVVVPPRATVVVEGDNDVVVGETEVEGANVVVVVTAPALNATILVVVADKAVVVVV